MGLIPFLSPISIVQQSVLLFVLTKCRLKSQAPPASRNSTNSCSTTRTFPAGRLRRKTSTFSKQSNRRLQCAQIGEGGQEGQSGGEEQHHPRHQTVGRRNPAVKDGRIGQIGGNGRTALGNVQVCRSRIRNQKIANHVRRRR